MSVVIAHPSADAVLARSIAAHRAELQDADELLVVLGRGGHGSATLLEGDPRARVLAASAQALTPELWYLGLVAARGAWLRLSIGCVVPEPGWRAALLAAHARGADAVGGAILPGEHLRARDWAIYFQRYRNFRPPFEGRVVGDVPGDHASYRRSVLAETADSWKGAFWEREVNRELHRRGKKLVLDPAFRARYEGGESPRSFLARRFRHGIQFGRERMRGASAARRMLHVVAFVAPGLVFLARIAREALAVPGSLAPLLRSLPWLLAFVSAWSLGEWIGACLGPPRAALVQPRGRP